MNPHKIKVFIKIVYDFFLILVFLPMNTCAKPLRSSGLKKGPRPPTAIKLRIAYLLILKLKVIKDILKSKKIGRAVLIRAQHLIMRKKFEHTIAHRPKRSVVIGTPDMAIVLEVKVLCGQLERTTS